MPVARPFVRPQPVTPFPSRRFHPWRGCLFALCVAILICDRGTTAAQVGSPLPGPWVAQAIGRSTSAANTSFRDGTFTIDAAGGDLRPASDAFNFVYQQVSGDVEIVARLDSLVDTGPGARAGVMIRGSLAGDAPRAYAVVSSAGVAFERRVGPGAATSLTPAAPGPLPRWVRLVRVGTRVTAFSSTDGSAWTTLGSDAIALGGTVFVGLAVTSQSSAVLTTADISNVSVLLLRPSNGGAINGADATAPSGAVPAASTSDGSALGASAPAIATLSPTSGIVGTPVTITGANFGSNLLDGKIGWWGPFQAGVQPANLIAGKPDAAFVGSPAFSSEGGGAFTSSGSSYLAIPDGGATDPYAWTSGAWAVQVDFTFPVTPLFSGGAPLMLMSKGSFATGTGWALQINNSVWSGKYQIQMVSNHGLGSYHSVTAYLINPGAFHRALFMCDGAGMGTWYVNGVAGSPQPCAPSSSAATSLTIGRHSAEPAYAAGFPISRVQIWNRVLTATEAIAGTTTDPSLGTVTFNGAAATPTSWSATGIVVPVPSDATTGPVVVTVGGQPSTGVGFTVTLPPPSVTTLSPATGAPGTVVTIAGANFGATQGTSAITFNGAPAAPVSWTATSIAVPVPNGAATGPVFVTVGNQVSNGVSFTVPVPPPAIAAVSPSSGVVGTVVTITGANFGATRGTSTVTFNGTAATPTSWSATSIVVPVPAGAATGAVVVTVGGQASSGVSYTVTLGPPPNSTAPWIGSLSPSSGSVGTPVTISGVNFGTAGITAGKIGAWGPFQAGVAPVNAVAGKPNGNFAGSPAFSSDGGGAFTSSAANYLAIADGGAEGAYAWTAGAWAVQVDFTFPATPSWTNGPLMLASKGSYEAGAGWAVQVNNSVWSGKYQIQLVSNHGTGSYHSVTTYQIVPGAFHRALFVCDTTGLGMWYVNGVAGSAQACAPSAGAATDLRIGRYAVDPAYAAALPISRVQIWNRALTASEAAQSTTSDSTAGTVTFNGTVATPTSWSPTSMTVPVPAGATTGPVVVTAGTQASSGVNFTVAAPVPPPVVTAVSPSSGVVGTVVTITGANFGATRGTSTVTFNGAAGTPTSWNATSIVVPVPAGAVTGAVVVTVGGQASSGVSYTVTLGPPPNSTAPWISGLSPSSGSVGTPVTISGVNFGTAGVTAGRIGAWGPFQPGVAPVNAVAGKPNGSFAGSPAFSSEGGGAFTSSAANYLAIADGGAEGAYAWTAGAWAVQLDFTMPAAPSWNGVPLMLASKGSFDAGTGWAIQINDSVWTGKYQIQFVSNHGVGSYHSVTAYQIVPGAFHRALFVCDSAGLGVWYVNGVAGSPQACAPSAGAATDLRIGRYAVDPAYAAALPISRVQIWNRALTASEAAQSTTGDSTAGTVTFNGTVATPTSWSATSMTVPVPAGATTGPVVVTAGTQASNSVNFTVTAAPPPPAPPAVAAVSPSSGVVGTVVTITGANFGATRGTSTVTFNGTAATPTSWSATGIVVPVPAGGSSGQVKVTVGGQTSNGLMFTVTAAPPPPSGAAYYVAPLSSNCASTAGSGTLADPWQNLFSAMTRHSFNPGDVIYLRGGTYRNSYGFNSGCNMPGDPGGVNTLLPLNMAGTSAAPIVIQNYPNETVVLDGTDVKLNNATWTSCGTESWQLNNTFNVGNARTGQVWINPTSLGDPGTRLAYDADTYGCADLAPGTFRFNGNGTGLFVRLPAGSTADLSDLHVTCETGNCANYPINDGPAASYVTVRKNAAGGGFWVKYGYYSIRVDDRAQNLTFDGIDIVAAGGRDYGSCARVYSGDFITFKNGSCRETAGEGMQLYGGGPGGSNGGGIQITNNRIENWTVGYTGYAWIDGGGIGNNLGFGVIIKNCSNCGLVRSTVHTAFGTCLEVTTSQDAGESDGAVIDGNAFSDCGYLNSAFGNRTRACMQIEPQRSVDGGAVRNGVYANNSCHNETFGNGSTWPAQFGGGVVNGLSMSDAGETPMSGNRIVNNSFDYLSGPGLNLLEASQPVTIRNNAFGAHLASAGDVCNGNGPCDMMLSPAAHPHSNNTYWGASVSTKVVYISGVLSGQSYTRTTVTAYEPSAVQGDPLFVSASDLRIQSGSPLMDAGTNTDCPATDAAGFVRPGGARCDVGAFELNSAVQALLASTDLPFIKPSD